MNHEGKLRPLRGIIPPMATPLASIDALDLPGLEVLVEHILGGGGARLIPFRYDRGRTCAELSSAARVD